MTQKEAVLKALEDLKRVVTYAEVCQHIIENNYCEFETKTPGASISALLGDFIRNGDSRVKRIKGEGATYSYYLAKYEQEIGMDKLLKEQAETQETKTTKVKNQGKTFHERSLHKLLSSYLRSVNINAKTIFHEQSKTSRDSHQKWIHPDMIGIEFLKLHTKASNNFRKAVNRSDSFKLSSYEIKVEINTDYDLKKYYFQAVSNSSWANYGYLVAFEFADTLEEEMKRLNQSFGIGIIELKANPYESKVLFPATYRELDYQTMDKLCNINADFDKFIAQVEMLLTADERYLSATEREFEVFCEEYFQQDSEIEEYCVKNGIPMKEEVEGE